MVRQLRPLAALTSACLALIATSCSDSGEGSGSPSAGPTTEAEETFVRVLLEAEGQTGAIFNLDNDRCIAGYTDRAAALFGTEPSQPVVVELQDADGTTLGSQSIEGPGGKFTSGEGCGWQLIFDDVPAGDIYRVKVTSINGEVSAVGESADFSVDVSNPH